jgi:basic membrane protein A and related proteins
MPDSRRRAGYSQSVIRCQPAAGNQPPLKGGFTPESANYTNRQFTSLTFLSGGEEMKKNALRILSGLIMASLLLAACAPATQPAPTPTTAPQVQPTDPPAATTQRVCQVTDVGGVDDKSFNQTAYDGVLEASRRFGWEGRVLESQQQTDYERNINEYLATGCDLIVTVGFLLGDATEAAARANPNQRFQILDFAYDPALDNVWAQVYAVNEAAFMTGYVAAAVSQTGRVGTFGGIPIPPVIDFMDGFALGVDYYNERHDTNVQVLGWDPANREGGLFTGNFESTDDGRRMAEALMDEGADIIMPVAGPVGLGTAAAVMERGNAYIIGVDTDWTVSAPEFASIVLTSVLKRLDVTVVQAVEAVHNGTFTGGTHLADLANDGVGIAPFHGLDHLVPDNVKAELEEIRADIIAGNIRTLP